MEHLFFFDGLVMAVNPLVVVVLVIYNGLGMAVVGLAACFGTMDGLGMCDFFLEGSTLECCGGSCDHLVIGVCLGKLMAHM